MTLSIALSSLGSRIARSSAVPGGIRRFATSGLVAFSSSGSSLPQKLWNGFLRFGNSLIANILNTLSFRINFSALWSWFHSKVTFLLTFNWNITDAQLDNQIKQAETQLASATGALVGGTLGWLVCGVVPGTAIAVFNQPLGLYVLSEVGEEAAEEIAGYVANVISARSNLQQKKMFAKMFKNHRSLLRGTASGVAKSLGHFGILNADVVAKLEKNKNEPWSFATAVEETIDAMKDPKQQAFWEEVVDEFADSCLEAGYIVANTLDSVLYQQAATNVNMGPFKMVRLIFDRSLPVPSTNT